MYLYIHIYIYHCSLVVLIVTQVSKYSLIGRVPFSVSSGEEAVLSLFVHDLMGLKSLSVGQTDNVWGENYLSFC